MKHDLEHISEQVSLYLQHMGIRTSTKGYEYLKFALVQLRQETPFQNSIWELTAIYSNQKRENVLDYVRREISHAYQKAPKRFSYDGDFTSPPKNDEFLRLSMAMLDSHTFCLQSDAQGQEAVMVKENGPAVNRRENDE